LLEIGTGDELLLDHADLLGACARVQRCPHSTLPDFGPGARAKSLTQGAWEDSLFYFRRRRFSSPMHRQKLWRCALRVRPRSSIHTLMNLTPVQSVLSTPRNRSARVSISAHKIQNTVHNAQPRACEWLGSAGVVREQARLDPARLAVIDNYRHSTWAFDRAPVTEQMRAAFVRAIKIPPRDYRKRFATSKISTVQGS
jgi:hypothetical protein